MGVLKNKILTYSPEQYYPNDSAYAGTTLANSGSGGTAAWNVSGGGPSLITTGGPDGSGCWRFSTNNASEQSARIFGSTLTHPVYGGMLDGDYSSGFWFRIPVTISGSTESSVVLGRISGGAPSTQLSLPLTGSSLGKISLGNPTTTTQNRYDDGLWHYYAERLSSSGGIYTKQRYIDGTFFDSATVTYSSSTLTYLEMADNFIGSATGSLEFIEIAHMYYGPSSSITATEIAEIYAAGTSGGATNITITETPATASALMVEPTIAVTAGDHVEITTSILVSAEFPSGITVGGDQNVNNVISGTLNALADVVNNVLVSTGIDVAFSALEMTADALLVEPILPVQIMAANATMPNATGSTTPNYYALVQSLDPVVYIPVGNEFPSWATVSKSYGSWIPTTVERSGTLTANSLAPMNLVGAGESSDLRNNSTNPRIFGTFNQTDIDNLITSRNYTIEYWTYLTGTFQVYEDLIATFNMKNLEIDYLGWYYGKLTPSSTNSYIDRKTITLKFGTGSVIQCPALNILQRNGWNHIVLKVTPEASGAQTYYLYVNGSVVASGTITPSFDTAANTTLTWERNLEGTLPDTSSTQPKLDEMAIYDYALSNSDIVTNYNFINSLSPNKTIAAEYFAASSESGEHNFSINSNVNYPETPVTASGIFVDPATVAEKVINLVADPMEASAANTEVNVYRGWTIYATPATAYAEEEQPYFLNQTYYNYVQANIAPYRYVSFDAADAYADYGIDNDYSVVPTAVGGTIVNPDLGINGKSAKTSGTAYSEGVILKESEWDDSWGTGQNSYHSAFWFQRAADDASTTGLRVLWNLNGYKDNQHVVLYQYQNKLHMQFNNGLGTWVEQDSGTLDLFDYERHFIVINFNHTNPVNNIVTLYVDSVAVMTVDLGAYTGMTTNAEVADSGPNDEVNNRPRLGIGCLITPFASTALPVVPTNTKLVIDEVYWDKNAINQTTVTNLFNTMPDKDNTSFLAEPMIASTELLMPEFSTSSLLATGPATASVELLEPATTADREVITSSEPMTADASFEQPLVFENKNILADVFLATAIFNDPGVLITIPGGPMTATAKIAGNIGFKHYDENGDYLNTIPLSDNLPPLIRYVRLDALNNRIPNFTEVK